MDLNDLRSAVTLLGLWLFIGLVAWTWRPARRRAHDAAARLPFDGDAPDSDNGAHS
ncbi:CcoQ/FixQ family Cbb3-type cytochrome c oxidase assembly chaperone [Piscinibacter sp. XHJ-5]|uniref:CcoQ/FixQ family Cbb3-type cytochrome c oxidase assembly chaperone n=1 Tax=Piscinibacter sp. XHJ-5 TaxID=3037797 RepID=UPI002452E172|nr:CcoQ/FixQ family Cbb3-type cytochrome c oxidase assembly chaperone [Piscinibacter sp. XHJ-5]